MSRILCVACCFFLAMPMPAVQAVGFIDLEYDIQEGIKAQQRAAEERRSEEIRQDIIRQERESQRIRDEMRRNYEEEQRRRAEEYSRNLNY